MKKIVVALVAILAIKCGYGQIDQPKTDLPLITVSARNVMKVMPDYCKIDIVLSTENAGSKTMIEQENKLLNVLRELDIDPKKNLKTDQVSSDFIKRKNIATKKKYILELKDLSKLSDFFRLCFEAQITNVQTREFNHTKIAEIQDQCRVDALKIAMEKAKILADKAGCEIGKIYSIVDQNWEPRGYRQNSYMRYDHEGSAEQSIDLSVKEIDVTVRIEASFLIKIQGKNGGQEAVIVSFD